jgi:hypothetical protein
VASGVDLEGLGLDRGGHLLVKRALGGAAPGDRRAVRGSDPHLGIHLRAWCRAAGHGFVEEGAGSFVVVCGAAGASRWAGAERAGSADPSTEGAVVDHPPARWGLAPRGALVEAGTPPIEAPLSDKTVVWSDDAARLYAQAAAAQWDPATAIPWSEARDLPPEVEAAVVQVMTYLVENETAALLVPARFLARIHPHFREVMQLLAVQTADEARHIEVFTRRARRHGGALGLSTAGGQASLGTLLDEPDFALASFLLSVLGEGSFLALLRFLHTHAPDAPTGEVARLAAQDEARHVAFGMSHLGRHAALDPSLRGRLAAAVERRHDALRHTAGLNEEVFDALVLLAAGGWDPAALARGHAAVIALQQEMDEGRQRRLRQLGFERAEAETLSALHTRNFM